MPDSQSKKIFYMVRSETKKNETNKQRHAHKVIKINEVN